MGSTWGRAPSGTASRAQPSAASRSYVIPSRNGWPVASRSRTSSSSVRCSRGSSRPRAAARRRAISVLGSASPSGAIGGLVEREVEVAPRDREVEVLDLRRGRQHDVGVARGVGEELLDHDREQVVARQSGDDPVLVGRITAGLELCTTSSSIGGSSAPGCVRTSPSRDMLRLRRSGRSSVASATSCQIWHERASPPTDLAPRAQDRGQHRDGAQDLLAVLAVLRTDQRADAGRPSVAIRCASHSTRSGSIPVASAVRAGSHAAASAREVVPPGRVPGDPVRVDEPVALEDVHQPEDQCDVGARTHLQEDVGSRRGVGADRVDHDDDGAGRPGLLDDRPQVAVGDAGVGPPQHDRARVAQRLGVDAERDVEHLGRAAEGGGAAQLAVDVARADGVEQPVDQDPHLDQALGAGEGELQDRLGPARVDQGAHPAGDERDRLVPRDRLELAAPLRAGPTQRRQHTVGVVHAVEETVHLGAQRSAGERVVGRAAQPGGHAVDDRDLPRARVRAVVVARPEHRQLGHGGTTRAWLWWRRDGTGR